MRQVTVDLKHGLTIGDKTHTRAVLKEATAGDVIDATEESEKLVPTPDGYELIASNTLVGANLLRRQIVSIGDYKGPLSLAELKKLHPSDLNLLNTNASLLEDAAIEVAKRGRHETSGSGD
jgi:phage FluMu protein gp41